MFSHRTAYLNVPGLGMGGIELMLRRALLITTIFTAAFALARWAVIGSNAPPGTAALTTATKIQAGKIQVGKEPTGIKPKTPKPLELEDHNLKPQAKETKPEPSTQNKTVAHPVPPHLISYRAVYDLTLHDSHNGSGVADVSGQMTLEFTDTCSGYVLNQRVQMRLDDGSGNRTQSDFSVANWEAHDGSKFRFATRHQINGVASQKYEGTATRDPIKGGKVVFTKPAPKTAPLAKETIFPTLHTIDLIKAAEMGKPVFAAQLFDGTGPDLSVDVVAAIGKPSNSAPKKLASRSTVLEGRPSWPVQLSFYDPTKVEELPDYQVSFRLYPNGVSSDMVLDYGDFSINALLTKIEALPAPAC